MMLALRRHIERAREQWRNIVYCRAFPPVRFLLHAARFFFDYRFRAGRASPPLSVSLMVTMRCDLSCAMCKLADKMNAGDRDMPLSLIERIVDELAPARPLVMLSGGEPFLRADIIDIIRLLSRRGLECGIFTNGLSLTPARADELTAPGLKVRFLAFSVLGPPEVHDRITGRPGAFARLEGHLRYFLKKRGKTTCFLSSTVSEDNLNHLEEIVALGKRWGVDFVRLVHPCLISPRELEQSREFMARVFPGEEIREVNFLCALSGKEERFTRATGAMLKRHPRFVYFTPSLSAEEIPLWYAERFELRRKCYFCWNSGFIYPNGDVCPCESFYYRLGNVNEQPFLEIWNNERYRRFRSALKTMIFPGCARCCKL